MVSITDRWSSKQRGRKNWSCFLDLSNCTSLGSVTMHGSGIITGLPREREETVHRFSLAVGLWTRERSRENPFHHQSWVHKGVQEANRKHNDLGLFCFFSFNCPYNLFSCYINQTPTAKCITKSVHINIANNLKFLCWRQTSAQTFTAHYTLNENTVFCIFSFTFSNPYVFCIYFAATFSTVSYFVDSRT